MPQKVLCRWGEGRRGHVNAHEEIVDPLSDVSAGDHSPTGKLTYNASYESHLQFFFSRASLHIVACSSSSRIQYLRGCVEYVAQQWYIGCALFSVSVRPMSCDKKNYKLTNSYTLCRCSFTTTMICLPS